MISIFRSVRPATSAVALSHLCSRPGALNRLFVLCIVLSLAVQGFAQQSLQVLHHHVQHAVSSGHAARVGSLADESLDCAAAPEPK
jgi:hypothetical protein